MAFVLVRFIVETFIELQHCNVLDPITAYAALGVIVVSKLGELHLLDDVMGTRVFMLLIVIGTHVFLLL